MIGVEHKEKNVSTLKEHYGNKYDTSSEGASPGLPPVPKVSIPRAVQSQTTRKK